MLLYLYIQIQSTMIVPQTTQTHEAYNTPHTPKSKHSLSLNDAQHYVSSRNALSTSPPVESNEVVSPDTHP